MSVEEYVANNKHMLKKADALTYVLGLPPGEQHVIDEDLRGLEYLLHEICHVVSLGIEDKLLNRGNSAVSISTHIHWAIKELPGSCYYWRKKAQFKEERKALAIEFNVWRLLKLPFTVEEMADIADKQDLEASSVLNTANLPWAKKKAERVLQLCKELDHEFFGN